MALRPGALRRGVMGTVGVQFARYSSIPSRAKMVREMEKTARQESKKMEAESMSVMQKRANDEYFRSGGGPLFPGELVIYPLIEVVNHCKTDLHSRHLRPPPPLSIPRRHQLLPLLVVPPASMGH